MRGSSLLFPKASFLLCVGLATVTVAWLGALEKTEALRHSYRTRHDHRSLIGPLGFPFGFLESGHYNLTVFDFQLSAPKKRHKHGDEKEHGGTGSAKELLLSDVLNNIKGAGFLLKKFKDEASFNHFMAYVQADPGRCIFQDFLNNKAEEGIIDDIDDFSYVYEDDMYLDDYYGYDDYTDASGGYGGYSGYEDDDYNRDLFRRRALSGALSQNQNQRENQYQYQRQYQYQQTKGHRVVEELEEEVGGEALFTYSGELDGIFLDLLPRSRWKPHSPSVAYDFEAGQAGFYFLMYQVCYNIEEGETTAKEVNDNHLYDIHSQFELDFHFSNKDMFGRVSYLPRGEMALPWLFFLFSMVYAACLYIWYSNIQLIKDGKQGYFDIGDAPTTDAPSRPGIPNTPDIPTIYPIHYLMGFLLSLKFGSLLFESIRYHYLRVIGHAVFFSAVYYTFAFLKGITLFTVILLIGSGWSFVKPFLSENEKKMIFGILVLQVLNNIAILVLTQETEGETSFDTWTAILHLVDILCCCAVLLPIVWQVNQLEKNMEQNNHKGKDDHDDNNNGSEEDAFINDNGDARIPEDELDDVPMANGDEAEEEPIPDARLASKLKLFRSFYILVIAYVYMTRIVVYLFAATLNYKHTWVRMFVVELTTIAFYCAVGYMFRPMNENPYAHLRKRRQGSDEGAQIEMRKIDTSTKVALD
mmetsp:Transcript_11142/g.23536  ORF Transcript_11142/g.23536 Transcript_11142/m.23536 type:complete len:697 (-) Transcript_11142:93-2183(-)